MISPEEAAREWTKGQTPDWVGKAARPEDAGLVLVSEAMLARTFEDIIMDDGVPIGPMFHGITLSPNKVRMPSWIARGHTARSSIFPMLSDYFALKGAGDSFDIVAGDGVNYPQRKIGRYSKAKGLEIPVP
jgi:hypothetical protein